MNIRSTNRLFILAIAMLLWPMLAAAQLNVMISGGFSGAYRKLLPEFEKASGIRVATGSGASQGGGPQTIAAQLARGVPADVVILSREGLDDLIAGTRIAAGTDVNLARVGMGIGVRAGAARPDVGTVEKFKRAMLDAKAVATGASTSGIWLVKELFPRLGIADQVKVKLPERGSQASGLVASGDADLVLLPVSEILGAAGVDYAAPFPAELQFLQTFSAAITLGSKQADAGKRLIDFLSSERASAVIRQSGMEPLERRAGR